MPYLHDFGKYFPLFLHPLLHSHKKAQKIRRFLYKIPLPGTYWCVNKYLEGVLSCERIKNCCWPLCCCR